MKRVLFGAAPLFIMSLLAAQSVAVEPDTGSDAKAQSEIYTVFLANWIGRSKTPVNVSQRAEPLSAEDIKSFDDCSGAQRQWMPVIGSDNLAGQMGDLSNVRMVNPDTWKSRDPDHLMAQGNSVDSAVRDGIDSGLMKFSVVALDPAGKTAALRYEFVCGRLCGSGGSVLFTKTQQGWIVDKRNCTSWIS